MSRRLPEEWCLANLREEIPEESLGYMTKDEAHNELVTLTGQDFGFDADQWEQWLHKNPTRFEELAKTPEEALNLVRRLRKRKGQ